MSSNSSQQEEEAEGGFWYIERILWEQQQLQEDIEDEEEQMAHEEEQYEASIRRTKSNLTLTQRRLVVDNLLAIQVDGKLPWGFMTRLAAQVGCHKCTISRIYKDVMQQREQGNAIDVRSKRYGKCGRKAKEFSDEFLNSMWLGSWKDGKI